MQQNYNWISGGPVAFQQFKHFYYGRKIIEYICSQQYNDLIGFYPNSDLCPNLTLTKISARDTLHSSKVPVNLTNRCILMLLSNLREPDWISTSCEENLLAFTVCRQKGTTKGKYTISKYKSTLLYLCKSDHILVHGKCYSFLWNEFWNMAGQVCNDFKARAISMKEFISFYHIFDAVSSVNMFPSFVILNKKTIQVIHIHKLFSRVRFTAVQPKNSKASGHVICNFNKKKAFIGINMFKCRKGGYILQRYVCDGIIDCPIDRSDEEFCICGQNEIFGNETNLCMKLKNNETSTQCTFNYYMEINEVCKKYDSNLLTNKTKTQLLIKGPSLGEFMCNSGKPLHASLVNDLVSDCGPKFEDEPALLLSMNKTQTFVCRPQEIPCLDVTDICSYRLNTEYCIIPCRNGGHLENCAKFECNMMFKCHDSYCIPWIYVCDGKWDCPNGDDEETNNICNHRRACQNMFKCRDEHHKCISIGQICDNKLDCLHHDDEMFCELKSFQCPISCNCLIFAITCNHVILKNLQFNLLALHLSVFISESNLNSLSIFDYKLQHIRIIHLPQNHLKSICPVLFLTSLLLLNFEFNDIVDIKKECFSASNFLKRININNNHITYLHTFAFHNLHHLMFLNLSSNPLINLPSKCFSNLFGIKLLNLENISFQTVDPKAFISTYVKLIKTLDYRITCVIPHNSYSTTYPPWYLSCSDIIPHLFLKNIYISVSLLVMGLNSLSIFVQMLNGSRSSGIFKIKEIGLNLSDILCGLYLTCVWFSDSQLESGYLVNENVWKSHPLCFTGYNVALWFTVSCQIILLYISTFRLMAVINPMKIRQTSLELVFYQISMVHLFSLSISVAITLVLKFLEKHVATSLCLPFVDPSGSSILTKIISWITILSQSISSVLIVFMHSILISKVYKVKRSIKTAKSTDLYQCIKHIMLDSCKCSLYLSYVSIILSC